MCGLGGYFLPEITPEREARAKYVFTNMMVEIEARGTDAAGLAYITPRKPEVKKKSISHIKSGKTASLIIQEPGYHQILSHEGIRAVIGHTRAKTKGDANNNNNNHPIVTDTGLAMAHNGIISNDDDLFELYSLQRDGEVDSEIIIRMVDMYIHRGKNMVEAIQAMAKEVKGSMAASIITTAEPDTLYLLRRTSPLDLIYDDKNKIIYYASLAKYISDSMVEHEKVFGLFTRSIFDYDPIRLEMPDDTLYKITVDGMESYPIEEPTPDWQKRWTDKGDDAQVGLQLPSSPVKVETLLDVHDLRLPIKKPSQYTNNVLEDRMFTIEQELDNGLVTGNARKRMEDELRRIEGMLAIRYAREDADESLFNEPDGFEEEEAEEGQKVIEGGNDYLVSQGYVKQPDGIWRKPRGENGVILDLSHARTVKPYHVD